jgi:hypothetical protein
MGLLTMVLRLPAPAVGVMGAGVWAWTSGDCTAHPISSPTIKIQFTVRPFLGW